MYCAYVNWKNQFLIFKRKDYRHKLTTRTRKAKFEFSSWPVLRNDVRGNKNMKEVLLTHLLFAVYIFDDCFCTYRGQGVF